MILCSPSDEESNTGISSEVQDASYKTPSSSPTSIEFSSTVNLAGLVTTNRTDQAADSFTQVSRENPNMIDSALDETNKGADENGANKVNRQEVVVSRAPYALPLANATPASSIAKVLFPTEKTNDTGAGQEQVVSNNADSAPLPPNVLPDGIPSAQFVSTSKDKTDDLYTTAAAESGGGHSVKKKYLRTQRRADAPNTKVTSSKTKNKPKPKPKKGTIPQKRSTCNHAIVDLWMEDNAGFFKKGHALHEIQCDECKRTFVHHKPSKNDEIRPSFDSPAYHCKEVGRRESSCKYALCKECCDKKEEVRNDDDATTRCSKRSRRHSMK
jgi:hypothetical protein